MATLILCLCDGFKLWYVDTGDVGEDEPWPVCRSVTPTTNT